MHSNTLKKAFSVLQVSYTLILDINESVFLLLMDIAIRIDLAYCYKQCMDGIEEVKRKTWSIFKNELVNPKDKLLALKLIKECNEAKFTLFKDGPSIMNLKALEERLNKVESGQINQ